MMTICRGSVMVLDANTFEAEYIAATLRARGLQVLGPFADAGQARSALACAPELRAAAVAQAMAFAAPDLLGALRDAGVHLLLLLPSVADPVFPSSADVLAKPFAAYQVADWAEAILAGDAGGPRSNRNVVYPRAAEADVPAPNHALGRGWNPTREDQRGRSRFGE